jgi:hypothetical protein
MTRVRLPVSVVVNAYAQHERPQPGRQPMGTIGTIGRCGSNRHSPCIAIRLVSRVRGPLFIRTAFQNALPKVAFNEVTQE